MVIKVILTITFIGCPGTIVNGEDGIRGFTWKERDTLDLKCYLTGFTGSSGLIRAFTTEDTERTGFYRTRMDADEHG